MRFIYIIIFAGVAGLLCEMDTILKMALFTKNCGSTNTILGPSIVLNQILFVLHLFEIALDFLATYVCSLFLGTLAPTFILCLLFPCLGFDFFLNLNYITIILSSGSKCINQNLRILVIVHIFVIKVVGIAIAFVLTLQYLYMNSNSLISSKKGKHINQLEYK